MGRAAYCDVPRLAIDVEREAGAIDCSARTHRHPNEQFFNSEEEKRRSARNVNIDFFGQLPRQFVIPESFPLDE